MWKINGKIYDLSKFLDKHPGGSAILKACQGEDDLTATFESYHAMCDRQKIEKIMKKYEIGTCQPSKYKFEPDGFYNTLRQKVRKVFRQKDHHSNLWWQIKSFFQAFIYLLSFFSAFYSRSNFWIRLLSSILAGHMIIQTGFSIMHDASHFAVSKKNSINEFLSDTWNAIAFWDGQLWLKHHSFRHHAFTGDPVLDPDTFHFKPFIRKLIEHDPKKYWSISQIYPKTIALIVTCIFPGMFMGQGLLYNFIWLRRGYLWGIKNTVEKFSWYQICLKLVFLLSIIYGSSFIIAMMYFISANITYFVCIMPDHDTFETHLNRIHDDKNADWGEIQARHSGNFATDNPWIGNLFGGINYQIEHHLFPTICHVHFDKIKPIVEETCQQFNIKYVNNDTMFEAVCSTLKMYSEVSKLKG